MERNNAYYEKNEIELLCQYFIGCIDVGFFDVSDLKSMVDKFCDTIKEIRYNFDNFNYLDRYRIIGNILLVWGDLKEIDYKSYEINFYKAVTDVIIRAFNCADIGIRCALTQIASEEIYMAVNGRDTLARPEMRFDRINGKKFQLRTSYSNYILPIVLTKQLLTTLDVVDELKIISEMFYRGYSAVIGDIMGNTDNDDYEKTDLCSLLDIICYKYFDRLIFDDETLEELKLLEEYQKRLGKRYDELSEQALSFLNLVTTDELRFEISENIKSRSKI